MFEAWGAAGYGKLIAKKIVIVFFLGSMKSFSEDFKEFF